MKRSGTGLSKVKMGAKRYVSGIKASNEIVRE